MSRFLIVVSLVTGAIHCWLWLRLVRDPAWPGRWRRAATWALVLFALAIPSAILATRALPRPAAAVLAWIGFTWLGVMFYLLVALLPFEPLRAVAWLRRRRGGFDPSRRALLARTPALVGMVAAGVMSGAAALSARRIAVKRVRITVAGLDPRLDGFRIAQICDLHVGPTLGEAFAREVVDIVNSLDADVAVLVGDLVDGTIGELRSSVAPLAGLRARHGALVVTGNHEYYSGADEWMRHFGEMGLRPLRNAHVTVERGGASLTIAGVDDVAGKGFGGGPDVARALLGSDPALPVVLLAHQPRVVHEAQAAGVAVQLSGHTHGGQLWPFGWFVHLAQPAVAGLHRFGGTALYVSCGTGYWGPPMRSGAPAEVTLVELVRA